MRGEKAEGFRMGFLLHVRILMGCRISFHNKFYATTLFMHVCKKNYVDLAITTSILQSLCVSVRQSVCVSVTNVAQKLFHQSTSVSTGGFPLTQG